MAQYEELLKDFSAYSRSAEGSKSAVLMQHIAQRLHESTTRYNWVGFYLMEAALDALALGPYVGSFMPTLRIPLDQGLCGAAASSGKSCGGEQCCGRSPLSGLRSCEIQHGRPHLCEESRGGGVVYRELLCRYLSIRRSRNLSSPAPRWSASLWKKRRRQRPSLKARRAKF